MKQEVQDQPSNEDIQVNVILFRKLAVVFALIISSLIVIFIFPYVSPVKKTAPLPIVSSVNLVPKETKLVLNGVFLTRKEKIAMINNKQYQVGDKIDGKQIISMNMNVVVLRKGDQLFELHM